MIEHLLIDSRKLVFPSSTLFFAIKTERNDGHAYVEELYDAGVRHFMVTDLPELTRFPQASFYQIADVVGALQRLAVAVRDKFNRSVIGITGSNGKTIVKEWLHHMVQDHFHTVRSPRSWNSQLGVPLSIWQMEEVHDLAIIEAGVSMSGEMKRLEKIVRPTIGICTNIGEAHNEGFSSIEQKLKEKLLLFQHADVVIYCKDHVLVDSGIRQLMNENKIRSALSWGADPSSDLIMVHAKEGHDRTRVTVKATGNLYSFVIPYVDAVALENAMHCFATVFYLGLAEQVVSRMLDLPPLSMRLEMRQGIQGCTIINDSYNADLTGLLSALDFMVVQQGNLQRTAILSDLTGIGLEDATAYQMVAAHLRMRNVNTLIAVGERFYFHAQLFRELGINTAFYPSVTALLKNLHPSSFKDQVILVKGARVHQFERISQLLENKVHRTRLEIDLAAMSHNIAQYRSQLKKGVKIMAMVKAFSYGAGSVEVASLLQLKRIDYLAVAYADEGVALRKAGIRSPIMVMNAEPSSFQALIDHDLEPELYSFQIADALQSFLQAEGITHFPVHIKLDTGMHRLGFDPASLHLLLEKVSSAHPFVVKSAFTHLVASGDSRHDDVTRQQLRLFDEMCMELLRVLRYPFIRHAANSAAISRFPEASYDMVRLGIGLYGVDPADAEMQLTEVATLKTTIAQIKQVKRGETVGYGRHAVLKRDSRIATIRIGYADGYPRSLGNGTGSLMIKGHTVPTVGNICMDMTMVDITENEDITLDDEVVVFGPQFSIVRMAEAMGGIPYEIMTGISQRVPRVYFGE